MQCQTTKRGRRGRPTIASNHDYTRDSSLDEQWKRIGKWHESLSALSLCIVNVEAVQNMTGKGQLGCKVRVESVASTIVDELTLEVPVSTISKVST